MQRHWRTTVRRPGEDMNDNVNELASCARRRSERKLLNHGHARYTVLHNGHIARHVKTNGAGPDLNRNSGEIFEESCVHEDQTIVQARGVGHSANAEKSGTCHQHLSQTHQRVGSRCARRQRSTLLSACGIVVPLCSHHQVFFAHVCRSANLPTHMRWFKCPLNNVIPCSPRAHTHSHSHSLSLLTEFIITGLSPIFLSYLGHFPGRLFLGLRQGQLSRFGRMNKDTKCSDTVLTARELVPGALVL